MTNIAIIGANSSLSQALLSKIPEKFNVLQVFNNNLYRIDKSYNFIKIDEFLKERPKIEIIYFISSFVSFSEKYSDIKKIFLTNIQLLKRISYLYPNSKIINTSSVAVFKDNDHEITEDSELNPQSSYAFSKLWSELIVNNHKGGGVNVRISSLFGENMNNNTFLPQIMKDAILKNKIYLYGNGYRMQNYIYFDDVATILYRCLKYKKKFPLLAVNNDSYSNLDIANLIKSISPKLKIIFKGNDSTKSFRYNNTKTLNYLGIKFKSNFNEQITNTFLWMKKQY